MSDIKWSILCAVLVLNFIYGSHFSGFVPTATRRNLGLITICGFISICVHIALQWVEFNAEGSQYLYHLSVGMLSILTSGLYYIYWLPFPEKFVQELGWTPNENVGTLEFVDPGKKVDSKIDIARRKLHEELIHKSLESQERVLFETVRKRENGNRDGLVSSLRDVQRSGYYAYDFLEYIKYRRPTPILKSGAGVQLTDPSDIKEVLWWVDEGSLWCHNSFDTAPDSRYSALSPKPDNESVIFTNCVCVDRLDQVEPAINLIKQTLRNIPYYYTEEPSRNQFKYAVGIDVQFLEFPPEFNSPDSTSTSGAGLGAKSFRPPNGYDIGPDGCYKLDGTEPERNPGDIPLEEDLYLASCISVAVDKVLVVNFHVLHLIASIETAEHLKQLSSIFGELIFNPRIIKVWHNLQKGIIILDATLDEIYRGTKRSAFHAVNPTNSGNIIYEPTYKLRLQASQEEAFSTSRPSKLLFGEAEEFERECPYGFHTNAVDQYGHPCPCRSNNLDIFVIVEFIMRDIGLRPADDDGTPFDQRAWTEIRQGCKYNDFEQCLLHGDRSVGLLRILKSVIPSRFSLPAPKYLSSDCREECLESEELGPGCSRTCPNYGKWSNVSRNVQSRMFRTFVLPNFQQDSQLLGYVAGHVLSITMILRYLMTTENPRLLLERLRLWSNKPLSGQFNITFLRESAAQEVPRYIDCKWHSTSKLIKSVHLFVDNPGFTPHQIITWFDDKALRSSVYRPVKKVRFLEPEDMLCYFFEIFWQRYPKIFGEYIVQKIASVPSKPKGRAPASEPPSPQSKDEALVEFLEPERWKDEVEAGYVQSYRQFSLDEILGFFEAPDWTTITSQLLQMVVGYFELKLIYEYQNDIARVKRMRNQLEEAQEKIHHLTSADIETLRFARDVLKTTEVPHDHGPNWFTRTRDRLFEASKDAAVTSGGLFLKPGEELEYRDYWANRSGEIKSLLDSLSALQELNDYRVQKFTHLLEPIEDPDDRKTLRDATFSGVTPFQIPVLQSIFHGKLGEIGSDEYSLSTDPIILYWAVLVLRYARKPIRLRPKTFAQRVFDLTYSPTNFYIPLLRHVIKNATQISQYERSQPVHHHLDKDKNTRKGAAGLFIPRVDTQRAVEMEWDVDPAVNTEIDDGWLTDTTGNDPDPWDPEVMEDVPSWGAEDDEDATDLDEDHVDDSVSTNPYKGENWDPERVIQTEGVSNLFFDINTDVLPTANYEIPLAGGYEDTDKEDMKVMSAEKAQFLRMLNTTLNIWYHT